MISAYCRNIVREWILKEGFPSFKNFIEKYEVNLDTLSKIAERGYYQGEDYEDFDFYYDVFDEEGEIEANKKAEEYINKFLEDFENVRKEIKEKTGAVLNIGYANDETENLINEYYFYVENAFVKNPEIDDEFFKNIETLAIAEDF